MKTGTTAYYKDSFKEAIMTNYSMNKATPLAVAYSKFEAEINNSTTLRQDEKEVQLQNLQKSYDQTRDEIFGEFED
ncbi:hypothetical protein [Sporosarcina sp. G11-34]|uniref:hypothetical protein n=1 Tax=Sporosarcina sp. G11-34 TaxID=2849605 RepID=UPI0022A90214|nr:hypothetical protein [Sporosarcina sp. G11-34]MCZ2260702.1 hypothetical protein [Sporosarcina sp. G11-34]